MPLFTFASWVACQQLFEGGLRRQSVREYGANSAGNRHFHANFLRAPCDLGRRPDALRHVAEFDKARASVTP
jgi:hypothetical protein